MFSIFKPSNDYKDFTKAIEDRFKSASPKPKQRHYLRVTDVLTGLTEIYVFSSRDKLRNAKKALLAAENTPEMEISSKPILEEGEYIQ